MNVRTLLSIERQGSYESAAWFHSDIKLFGDQETQIETDGIKGQDPKEPVFLERSWEDEF